MKRKRNACRTCKQFRYTFDINNGQHCLEGHKENKRTCKHKRSPRP